MKKTLLVALAAVCGISEPHLIRAADAEVLWRMGAPDRNDAEFALAPGGWSRFKEDGLFIVGRSEARKDWPYVHPGPNDAWAGGRSHTFTILFNLKQAPGAGSCRLDVALVDTQHSGPPHLRVQIDGRSFDQTLPHGAGDDSVNGEPAKGRPHTFTIGFPSSLLQVGDNDVQITTLSGSWMIYDSVEMRTPEGAALGSVSSRTVISSVEPVRALRRTQGGGMTQPVLVTLRHFGEPGKATLRTEGMEPRELQLQTGEQKVEVDIPAVSEPSTREISLLEEGKVLVTRRVALEPIRELTVYILPHSHTDIGYTEIQTAVEKKQVNNLLEGIAAAKRTAGYPAGARFVWNVEVLWAADLYLHRLDERQRADFLEAVKKGQVVLNGMYLNELTGLCRPEELTELFRFATLIEEKTGVPIDSAMISDVPGYTWGTVTAMAQAGIKYFSTAPNYFDRIGTIMRDWENKPFYWEGPDGKSKVLAWIPFWGYAMSHVYHQMSMKLVDDFCLGLEQRGYPYDIAYVRWSGHGDNAVPDPTICDFVRDWNQKYASPHFIISGTSEAFRAFEKRYGDKLPVVRGDWTPYWEDGAGSSALETGMNRQSSDRLSQAEALFAMVKPAAFSAEAFQEAWKKVLLYSEHTWGAWCSISEPERKETREQWAIKKSYADDANRLSRKLLEQAAPQGVEIPGAPCTTLDIYNTLSWTRTELAIVPAALSKAGDRVTDAEGHAVPSQRLISGELAFLARDVPPFGAKRFLVLEGAAGAEGQARASGFVLDSGTVRVRVDAQTGAIVELTGADSEDNFVDTRKGEGLNDYRYLIGDKLEHLQRNGPVTVSVGEKGPLVASLIVESDAPGCKKLRRELRVVAGQDYVELIDLVDKARLDVKSYRDDEGKESLNFAFPFNVPDGRMLLDIPLGAMRPEADQMPSACKNWFTVGRWVDVSNSRRGITWVTLDAPLVEIGGLTARLLNSQTNPDVWRKHVEPTQSIYSWAMNNHWGTNYRAYQDGPTVFRFVLRPHREADPAENSRFAIGFSQPLLALPGSAKPTAAPLLRITPEDVIATALKPSDDGKAIIVQLFGASGKTQSASLDWGRKPSSVFLSGTSQKPAEQLSGTVSVPGYGVVTLRAEF